jgi:hypothetical protein
MTGEEFAILDGYCRAGGGDLAVNQRSDAEPIHIVKPGGAALCSNRPLAWRFEYDTEQPVCRRCLAAARRATVTATAPAPAL